MKYTKRHWHFTTFFSLVFAVMASFAHAQETLYNPIAVYLTWQHDPQTTMTVQWITQQERTDDLIEYHQKDQQGWVSISGSHVSMPYDPTYLIHRVELTGLQPGTDYTFRPGCDSVAFSFRTMPADLSRPIRFVSGGDMYHDDDLSELIDIHKQAARTDPMFALLGGDLAYAGKKSSKAEEKVDRWLTWLAAWKEHMVTPDGRLVPMVATIGNHDVNGRYSQTPEQAKVYYALFQEGYHVLDFGDYMSIFVLDTDHTSPIDGDQHIWLENALIERKDIPHKFAFYHVPAYPSVRKFGGKINARVRRFWVPLFERHDLTAAFEHHDHAYKRTYPIDRGNRHEGGVVYLGDGAWGVKKPRPPKNPKKVWYLAETAATQHFILVTIKGNERAFTAIDKEGKVFDSYTQKNSESGSLDQNFLTDKARRPRPT